MTFAEKLKSFRKQAKMSQEKLSEKLGVSRQAVTKWETGLGIPEIENIRAISELFEISIDELLSDELEVKKEKDYLFESITEYDIDSIKHYDIKLIGAYKIILTGYSGEKIYVRFASNTLADIEKDLKLKIDDGKYNIDLDVNYFNQTTKALTKEDLVIFMKLPEKYIEGIELAAAANTVEFHSLSCEQIEFDGKAENVMLDNVNAKVKLNCNLDMNIVCKTLNGNLKINQLFATSKLSVVEGMSFFAKKRGIGNSLLYEKDGKYVESFGDEDSGNIIELNGMKSELIISRSLK